VKNVEIISIEVSANPGCSQGDAIVDGIKIAVKEWRNVNVKHNGKTFSIKVNDILGTVETKD